MSTAAPRDSGAAPPERFSRQWFGGIFSLSFLGALALKFALQVFGWHQGSVLYWLIAGALFLGLVLGGVPWVVLSLAEGYGQRRRLMNEAATWLAVLVPAVAVAAGLVVAATWLT